MFWQPQYNTMFFSFYWRGLKVGWLTCQGGNCIRRIYTPLAKRGFTKREREKKSFLGKKFFPFGPDFFSSLEVNWFPPRLLWGLTKLHNAACISNDFSSSDINWSDQTKQNVLTYRSFLSFIRVQVLHCTFPHKMDMKIV